MSRLIDADALMKIIRTYDYPLKSHSNSTDNGMFTIGIQQAVDEQPTIDAVDLIRREDAIEAVVCHIWHAPDETRKLFNCENYVRDIVEEALKELPSADRPKGDWVEVIRCKDCKWWSEVDEDCDIRYGQCINPTYVISDVVFLNEDWYCADGERKEE